MIKKIEDLFCISIIIPCRNEEKFIGRCLDSIINNDYPKDKIEILVIDGSSEDETKNIILDYSKKYSFIKLLENPKKFTPFGLNMGIKAAKGEIILRVDAHARYRKDYISKCVKYLKEYNADNVGGIINTIPEDDTVAAKSIAISLSSFFGAGGSYFRLGSKKPREVDTVFGGCFKKEIFDKIGLFDERLVRSQDIEFNRRLKKYGGKIMLVPEIIADYYPQSILKNFLKHNFNDGIWTTYPLKFGINIFSFRHLIPLVFISGLFFLLVLSLFSRIFFYIFLFSFLFYFFSIILFSLKFVRKDIRFLFFLPAAFFCRHFGYGAGSILGLLKIL
ncbi:MAG: glycosyltransferase family 2 protein [Candidatus Nealsonbacteria bacterium]|nr:glycosyltransferase family 2 protein [Candidatus Nealsonbacteria bacterium]